MALPDIELTAGQKKVMDKLSVNVRQAQARISAAQSHLQEELEALEEYAIQAAEKLQIDIADYGFDVATGKFVDKAVLSQGK